MFSQLLESGHRSSKPGAQSFLSLAFHLAVGVGAIEVSRQVVEPPPAVTVDTNITYLPNTPVTVPESRAVPNAPQWTGEVPPADAFMVHVPVDFPTGIPPVDPGQPTAWRFAFPVVRGCEGCIGREADSTVVFTEESVDDPVGVLRQPRPAYPTMLESMGIAGKVTMEFVVSADGTVDPRSIRILDASHPAFGESAAKAIEGSTFRPARVRGVAVKQLVRQTVRFEAVR